MPLKTLRRLRDILADVLDELRHKRLLSPNEVELLQYAERVNDSLRHVYNESREGYQEP
jgi:hypothetical protein